MRVRIINIMYTKLNLSLSVVSQLRIYKKHGNYEFNPRDSFLQNLNKITIIKCFSPGRIMHYGISLAPEQDKNLLINIITHKPLPTVTSWQVNHAENPSFATGNAIFSGFYKEVSLHAVQKLLDLGINERNLR